MQIAATAMEERRTKLEYPTCKIEDAAMTMIDADKLKPALEAWRKAGASVAQAVDGAADATRRGDLAQADQLGKQTQYLAGDRDEAAEEVVLQLEALIAQATGP